MITLVVHVEDKPGVLTRVASLVRRRAFNIASLTVSSTENPGISRITLVVDAPACDARRLRSNLYKLVPVLHISDMSEDPAVFRDLALVKVHAPAEVRPQVLQIVQLLGAQVVDVSPATLIVEVSGDEERIDDLVELLRPFGILDLARSGRLAMNRGAIPAAEAGACAGAFLCESGSVEGVAACSA